MSKKPRDKQFKKQIERATGIDKQISVPVNHSMVLELRDALLDGTTVNIPDRGHFKVVSVKSSDCGRYAIFGLKVHG